MTARPVVTMDESDESLWLQNPERPDYPTYLGFIQGAAFVPGVRLSYEFATARAIADFLEQLEGANLLSGISEVGE